MGNVIFKKKKERAMLLNIKSFFAHYAAIKYGLSKAKLILLMYKFIQLEHWNDGYIVYSKVIYIRTYYLWQKSNIKTNYYLFNSQRTYNMISYISQVLIYKVYKHKTIIKIISKFALFYTKWR